MGSLIFLVAEQRKKIFNFVQIAKRVFLWNHFCCSPCLCMIISVYLHSPVLRHSLVWITLWSVLYVSIVLLLSIQWLVTVYCKSAVMTCFVNDGGSIGVLLQIVSIFQTHVDSGWGSCFSSLTASSLHVWYLRVRFWFNFQITCMWEHYWPSHVPLKTQVAYLFFSSREHHVSSLSGRLYGYTLKWYAPIRKSMWLKAGVYFHMDPSARQVFQHDS